ncbi:MAG: VOC family protein, partial [Verrucomicrobia bacterium]|nr:VOC family protein [Verrucomicrobiota bacterium]
MRIRHTMLRVADLERSLDFYTRLMGMNVFRRVDNEMGKFSIAFVGYGTEETEAALELTYNWGCDDGYDIGEGYG